MFLRIAIAFLATLPAVTAASASQGPGADGSEVERYVFEVFRDGARIGEHRATVTRHDDRIKVDIAIDFEVKLAFITVYRYSHRNREIWRDGELRSFRSETDNNGEALTVEGERVDGGMRLVANGEERVLPAWMPTTYWHPATIRQDRLVDTQDGDLLEIAVTEVGRETVQAGDTSVPATRYEMRGDLDITLWYDDADRWVKLAFDYKGASFDYVLKDPVESGVKEERWAARSGSLAQAQVSVEASR